MEDFISSIRTDRKREIAKYKSMGYTVSSNYICISSITVFCKHEEYSYNVQADKREIKFFISDKNANIYLSVFEIYELIYSMAPMYQNMFKMALKKYLINDTDKECYFIYKGVRYSLSNCADVTKGMVYMNSTGLYIESSKIYFLIQLIQEKSNSLFERSKKEDNKAYINGLFRLFHALLVSSGDNDILKSKGWKWSSTDMHYMQEEEEQKDTSEGWKGKYYLTDKEYKLILGNKKS